MTVSVLPASIVHAIEEIVGAAYVRRDDASRLAYGTDALKQGRAADLVALPGSAAEIAAILRLCAGSSPSSGRATFFLIAPKVALKHMQAAVVAMHCRSVVTPTFRGSLVTRFGFWLLGVTSC